jgi:hypothetical protein
VVVVCSTDPVFGRVLARNAEQRGLPARLFNWDLCHGPLPVDVPPRPLLIIADLNCVTVNRWALVVARMRGLFPTVPVVVLDYDLPDAARRHAWQPYRFLEKSLSLGSLLRVFDELAAVRRT